MPIWFLLIHHSIWEKFTNPALAIMSLRRNILHGAELGSTRSIRLLKPGGSLFLWNLPKWNYLSVHTPESI